MHQCKPIQAKVEPLLLGTEQKFVSHVYNSTLTDILPNLTHFSWSVFLPNLQNRHWPPPPKNTKTFHTGRALFICPFSSWYRLKKKKKMKKNAERRPPPPPPPVSSQDTFSNLDVGTESADKVPPSRRPLPKRPTKKPGAAVRLDPWRYFFVMIFQRRQSLFLLIFVCTKCQLSWHDLFGRAEFLDSGTSKVEHNALIRFKKKCFPLQRK